MSHRKPDSYLYGGSASARFQSRPRSMTTHFGSSPNVLGAPLSTYNALSSMYGHSPGGYRIGQGYSPYTSSFGRTSAGIYGGTSSGYGGVYLPSHQTLSSLNLMSPYVRDFDKKPNNPIKRYNWKGNKWKDALKEAANSIPLPSMLTSGKTRSTNNDVTSKKRTEAKVEHKSRTPSRSHSFNKERSSSASSLGRSGLKSRSTSLVSLTSDGYCSGTESKEDTGSKRVSSSDTPTENGAIDYKALWEASQAEVKKLKELMKVNDQQLRDAKATIERVTHVSQNSLTELEKREKRAMERKLSEMEEELKQLQKLKAENERLRTENRALTRVVSKLTNSAGK